MLNVKVTNMARGIEAKEQDASTQHAEAGMGGRNKSKRCRQVIEIDWEKLMR